MQHLLVGRLSSRAFDVTTGDAVHGSGPVDGTVLASWVGEGGTSQLAIVDTETGATSTIHETDRTLLPLLSPDGRTAYWLEMTEDPARVGGAYRRGVDGGETERIAKGWPGHVYSMDWATDGQRIVFAGLADPQPGMDEVLYEYRILDPTDGTLQGPLDFKGQKVAGLEGDDLIAYAVDPATGRAHLVSFDIATGAATDLIPGWDDDDRVAVEGRNEKATVVDDSGTPVLIVDGAHEGNYAIFRMALDGSDKRLLWESDDPWNESWVRTTYQLAGAETPGWLVIAPASQPFPWPPDDGRPDPILVSIADGTVVELPSMPELGEPVTAAPSATPS
ncbi:MAG: hypothetical protein U0667_00470 [Chloroflexota bacterium]